jgi:zinc transport system substrate-binding protein
VNVVTTFYPVQFLAEAIGGEDIQVINLIEAGVEPHDYTPRSRDMDFIERADLLLYNGAGFEGWIPDLLEGLSRRAQLVAVDLSQGIDLIETTHAHEHEDGDEPGASMDRTDEVAVQEVDVPDARDGSDTSKHDQDLPELQSTLGAQYVDPHTWVSPRSMLIMAENVYGALCSVDAAHTALFTANYQKLRTELERLDDRYTAQLAPYAGQSFVVNHDSFSYVARDYQLQQVAVMGLAPDSEPLAQDLLKIVHWIEDNHIQALLFEQNASTALATTLQRETGVRMLALYPLEGLTQAQAAQGADYFSLMRVNLQNLVQALAK